MNLVIIGGRLGRDPELRYTAGGQAVASFDVALNEKRGEQQGTTWVRVTCWQKHADRAQRLLKRGSFVLVQGRLRQRTWERDGVKHKVFEVNADVFRTFSDLDEDDRAAAQQQEARDYEASDADIPF